MRRTYEAGTTAQFDLHVSPYAVPLDALPLFKVTGLGGWSDTITAQQSAQNAFYAVITTPSTPGSYLGQWTAASSGFPFASRFMFEVQRTRVPE
ncbi:MAG: hypothetical protein KKA22_04010 [Gammaproteobacteria bacterium]|nr:hypothetical protein [Gammaproteobacteria bacterium]MBU1407294.1 hypothetical protein [Gammaproteobacteria bacterium]MBU1531332.1 hypothetical protein [Gammaproteobacteria bacterium]